MQFTVNKHISTYNHFITNKLRLLGTETLLLISVLFYSHLLGVSVTEGVYNAVVQFCNVRVAKCEYVMAETVRTAVYCVTYKLFRNYRMNTRLVEIKCVYGRCNTTVFSNC
jgi:hypothetical protein